MSNVSNVNYYLNLGRRINEFRSNNDERKANRKFTRPHLLFTDPLSRFFVEKALMPVLKRGYSLTESALISGAHLFSLSLSARIEHFFYDPISTQKLISIGAWIEAKSKDFALRNPTQLPLIQYLDTCCISAVRHLYVFSKDVNTLLRIPQQLHNYVNWEIKRAELGEKPLSAGKGLVVVS